MNRIDDSCRATVSLTGTAEFLAARLAARHNLTIVHFTDYPKFREKLARSSCASMARTIEYVPCSPLHSSC
jgi:hypothetical protein